MTSTLSLELREPLGELSDGALSDLILAQYEESGRFWDEDEAYRASRRLSSAEVDVVLGSSWVEVTTSIDSGLTVHAFMHGGCGYIAGELHRVTGLPLVRFTSPDRRFGWQGHWAVEVGPDSFLDIRGLTDASTVLEEFSNGSEWAWERGPHLYGELLGQLREGAATVVDELDPLEAALVRRYVGQLLKLL